MKKINQINKKPELLAPIQDFLSLKIAIDAGCDAVYFGIKGINMRSGAKNFTVSDLKKIVKICHNQKIKCYLALNVIVYEEELGKIESILKKVKEANVDAVICWDHAIIKMAKKFKIEIHLSTQASVANSEAIEFYKKQGVKRFVLARECTLEQIKKIKKKVKVELETFAHGAMCVSESGRCFLSQFTYGKSANRGECIQPCRRKYIITEKRNSENDKHINEYELGEDYVLSPKDMCTLPFVEKLIDAEIDVLKIEGRNRSPEYVKKVIETYREVIDFYVENKSKIKRSKQKADEFLELKKRGVEELKTVYNRGFSNGFYLGKPINEWTHSYGSQATQKKVHLGKVVHFYSKIKVAEIKIEAKQTLRIKDKILIQGDKTGLVEQVVSSMEFENKQIRKAEQGETIAVSCDKAVKKGDTVYKVIK
jgi:U32 family peptidase